MKIDSYMFLCCWSFLLVVHVLTWQAEKLPSLFKVPTMLADQPATTKSLYKASIVSHKTTPSVHSASAIDLPNGDLLAFWYGGKREGAQNVNIYAAKFDAKMQQWGQEKIVITRLQAQEHLQRYIRKLGNSVVIRDQQGRIWLFYVSVSIGGWSGSSINYILSLDNGISWSKSTRLVTSPFLNVSTLVRGKPVLYQDGSIGLPAYHELFSKFGQWIHIDFQGNIRSISRMSANNTSFQPDVLIDHPSQATAFFRQAKSDNDNMLMAHTSDGGKNWSELIDTQISNYDAALSGHAVSAAKFLLAVNYNTHKRDNLSLIYYDKKNIRGSVIHTLEAKLGHSFSYPWISAQKNGLWHVFYTVNRDYIKQITFSKRWLTDKISAARLKNNVD